MRLSLTVATVLLLAGASTPAALAAEPSAPGEKPSDEAPRPGSGVPLPLSGDPPWRAQAAFGAGVVMVNTAGGQHHISPEITAQASWRRNRYLTFRSRLDATWRKDGTDDIFVENTHWWLSLRPEATLGSERAQFVFGLGPSVILTTTRLHGPGRNVHANSLRFGFEYGVGLRWMAGRWPMGVDFGGQQRQTRHDFRATVVFGIPLLATAPATAPEGTP